MLPDRSAQVVIGSSGRFRVVLAVPRQPPVLLHDVHSARLLRERAEGAAEPGRVRVIAAGALLDVVLGVVATAPGAGVDEKGEADAAGGGEVRRKRDLAGCAGCRLLSCSCEEADDEKTGRYFYMFSLPVSGELAQMFRVQCQLLLRMFPRHS